MKIEKLPRDFVYTDRRTLDDFLRSDDLNKELYKVYLRVKDRPYYIKFDAEKAFNEAYRIMGIDKTFTVVWKISKKMLLSVILFSEMKWNDDFYCKTSY